MSWFDLLVLGLATWWISYTITTQKGPYDLLTKLREKVPLGGLTSCIYCLSIWVAIGLFLLWNTSWQMAVYPFAIAGAALMLHRYVGFNHV